MQTSGAAFRWISTLVHWVDSRIRPALHALSYPLYSFQKICVQFSSLNAPTCSGSPPVHAHLAMIIQRSVLTFSFPTLSEFNLSRAEPCRVLPFFSIQFSVSWRVILSSICQAQLGLLVTFDSPFWICALLVVSMCRTRILTFVQSVFPEVGEIAYSKSFHPS